MPVYVLRGHEVDITKHLMQQHCGEYSKEHAEQFYKHYYDNDVDIIRLCQGVSVK